MTVRPWLVAAAGVATLAAWSPATPAGPSKYKVELKTSVTQDLTALGQDQQKQEFSNTAWVTVTTRDSADGEAVVIVLDSLMAGAGSPFAAGAAESKGLSWTGFRQPNGRVKELTPDREGMVGVGLLGMVQQLIPPMKRGTPEGQAWTDTTDATNQGVAVRTVTNFQTSGAMVDGHKVVKLAGSASTALSGQQESPNGTMQVDGTGSSTGNWMVAADGLSVSASFSGIQNISVTVTGLPAPIPVTVVLEGSAMLLP